MKKNRIEKQIEDDILSSLPDNDLSFEKIENRIDYGRFTTPKKKSKAKFILIPLGALASVVVLAFAIPIIVLINTPSYGGDPAYCPTEGSYEISSVSGDDVFLPFEIGQKAEVSSTTDITEGCLPLQYSLWGLDGRLEFVDGPLSEINLDYEGKVSGDLIFTFDYSGLSYDGSIAFRSPMDEKPTITVTITNASEETLTLLFS